jgi:hypothetical protein
MSGMDNAFAFLFPDLAEQVGAGPRAGRGRGKGAKSLELIDACHEILAEIQPASVRAVCYRLFTMGLIPNMGKSSTNGVSRQLVYARENGLIEWEWIVDETRDAERISSWHNPDQIIDAAVRGYRRDYWQDQPCRVEVWSEKGTIRGTLAPVLNEFGVTFRVMHGYGSATALNTIADESISSDKPLTAFYVGDWDPSGLHMSEVDLPERLERYGAEIEVERIALAESDVRAGTELPHFDAATKTGDPRHRWFVENFGHHCWELDAMSPVVLRERVQFAVVTMLDSAAWKRAIEVEAVELESMRGYHKSWQASKRTGGAT